MFQAVDMFHHPVTATIHIQAFVRTSPKKDGLSDCVEIVLVSDIGHPWRAMHSIGFRHPISGCTTYAR